MQALEDPKQLAGIFHIDADTIVSDDIHRLAILDAALNLDARICYRSRVFDSIVQKIRNDLLHHPTVGECSGQHTNFEFDRATSNRGLKLLIRSFDHLLHVNFGRFQLDPSHPREGEYIIDQLTHFCGVCTYYIEDSDSFLAKL